LFAEKFVVFDEYARRLYSAKVGVASQVDTSPYTYMTYVRN